MTDRYVRPAQEHVFITEDSQAIYKLGRGVVTDVGIDIDPVEIGRHVVFSTTDSDFKYMGQLVIRHNNIIGDVA